MSQSHNSYHSPGGLPNVGTFPSRPTGNETTTEIERLQEENARLTTELTRITVETSRLSREATRLDTHIGRLESAAVQNENISGKLRSENLILTERMGRMTTEVERESPLVGGGYQGDDWELPRVRLTAQHIVQDMNENRLKQLDAILKGIVKKVRADISWGGIGETIEQELGAVGIRLENRDKFLGGIWDAVEDVEASGLMRINAAASATRTHSGAAWYSAELLKVVQELMELRGFEW